MAAYFALAFGVASLKLLVWRMLAPGQKHAQSEG